MNLLFVSSTLKLVAVLTVGVEPYAMAGEEGMPRVATFSVGVFSLLAMVVWMIKDEKAILNSLWNPQPDYLSGWLSHVQ